MRQGHLPYGYRIVNGVAVVDEVQATRVRRLFEAYLSGKGYVEAARTAGLEMYHSSAKRIMQNRHYLGDDFYPALIGQETFDAAEKERLRRIEYLGRKRAKKPKVRKTIPTNFRLGAVTQKYKDPYEQAAYAYSLIESGE